VSGSAPVKDDGVPRGRGYTASTGTEHGKEQRGDFEAGVDVYLQKPVQLSDIIDTVRMLRDLQG
jgi:CheY-like chemotaxis protein